MKSHCKKKSHVTILQKFCCFLLKKENLKKKLEEHDTELFGVPYSFTYT